MIDFGPRAILHVDLDAFYAAVELREDPSLAGRPVVIGADPRGGRGRGVVSTASYEARRFGIRSAMPVSEAWRRCPDAVFLTPRHDYYVQCSKEFFAILARFTDCIEPLSIDEAFLDVTGSRRLFGDPVEIAHAIQNAVREEQRLGVSVGVAPIKFVAKIASDLRKPRGLVVVAKDQVREFLDPLPISRLFGAGPKVQERLRAMGADTIADVRALPLERLSAALGATSARHLHDLARGIDPRRVDPNRERKSLGKEHTFDQDVADRDTVETLLLSLLEQSTSALRVQGLRGGTVTVKVRTSEFRTTSRSRSLAEPSASVPSLWPLVRSLFRDADTGRGRIRLVGVSFSRFALPEPGLFEDSARGDGARTDKLDAALDAVTRRFGNGAVVRARLLDL